MIRLKVFLLKNSMTLMMLIFGGLLSSCASDSLKAPCPDYGKHCDTTPVNSWDTSTV